MSSSEFGFQGVPVNEKLLFFKMNFRYCFSRWLVSLPWHPLKLASTFLKAVNICSGNPTPPVNCREQTSKIYAVEICLSTVANIECVPTLLNTGMQATVLIVVCRIFLYYNVLQ